MGSWNFSSARRHFPDPSSSEDGAEFLDAGRATGHPSFEVLPNEVSTHAVEVSEIGRGGTTLARIGGRDFCISRSAEETAYEQEIVQGMRKKRSPVQEACMTSRTPQCNGEEDGSSLFNWLRA